MNVNTGHERTSKARIIHQIQLIRGITKTTIYATEELIQLKISQAEGYENVTITGTRLDMDSDFKTWIGVVRSIAEHGNSDGMVEMSITELAKLCGFPSTEVRTRLGFVE